MGLLPTISVSPVGKKAIGAVIVLRRMELVRAAPIIVVPGKARSPAIKLTRTSPLTQCHGKR
jgi:hypothetical protein